jgi:hypothetical protein
VDRDPPGFNLLFDRRARAVSDLLGPYVLAVFCLDEAGGPSFEGSCVAVKARGSHFVLSAAHVLNATIKGGVHLLLKGREQNPLQHPTWLTLTKYPGHRHDDPVDVGYVRLKEAEIAAIGEQNFLDVSNGPPPRTIWSSRHFLLGFPAHRQSRDDIDMKYNLEQTYFTSPEILTDKYAPAGLDQIKHFAMRFEGSRIVSKRGRGGQPNFRGMSGGGVWVMDPYTDYSAAKLPPFAGILVGRPAKNKKVLFGSRIGALFSMLDSEIPLPAAEHGVAAAGLSSEAALLAPLAGRERRQYEEHK